MKKSVSLAVIGFLSLLLIVACTNAGNTKSDSAVDNTAISKKAVDSAFKRMWENVTLTNLAAYMKTDVADDFFTIDADGVAVNMEQTLADTTRLSIVSTPFFRQCKLEFFVDLIN